MPKLALPRWLRREQEATTADVASAQAALEDSSRRLRETQRDVIVPLHELGGRDEVAHLVRGLLRET